MEYEVRCPRCDVSFPVGTKTCLHCGDRIPRHGRSVPDLQDSLLSAQPMAEPAPGEGLPILDVQDAERLREEEGQEEEAAPRSIMRIGSSVIWIFIIAMGMLARMCEG